MEKSIIKLREKVKKVGKNWSNEYQCFCGNTFLSQHHNIKSGATKSCGCHKNKVLLERNTKHGLSKLNRRLYSTWKSLRARCKRKSHISYKNYGGRGISVCEEWDDFFVFSKWAKENGYSDNLTIERIDYNGDYAPENCKWISSVEQNRNKRTGLGWDLVKEIRQKYVSGMGVTELSKEYKKSVTNISRIVNNHLYTDENFNPGRPKRIYKKTISR